MVGLIAGSHRYQVKIAFDRKCRGNMMGEHDGGNAGRQEKDGFLPPQISTLLLLCSFLLIIYSCYIVLLLLLLLTMMIRVMKFS